jgi:hypothetical protein
MVLFSVQRSDLRELLRHQGCNQFLVTGVLYMGCLLSADAFMSDVPPFFVANATADFLARGARHGPRLRCQPLLHHRDNRWSAHGPRPHGGSRVGESQEQCVIDITAEARTTRAWVRREPQAYREW